MNTYLKAAWKTLPPCALLFIAGVAVLAIANLGREATTLWFAGGAIASLLMWMIATHEVAERGGK